jgi:phenylpyruvate tautomerase PptA (4-oxalocrotonate tautomerase family)
MPMTRIEVRRPRPPEQVQALIQAVHEAQREALKLPEVDLGFRLDV